MHSRLPFVFLFTFWFTANSISGFADDELSAKQIAWFESNIRPILVRKCYTCHSEKKAKDEGGLTLDTRQGWKVGGDHGPAIVPGDADASLLIRAIRYQDSDLEMPPDKKLTDREIKLLEQWVRAGAADPRTGKAGTANTIRPSDPVAGKSHWAFQPLSSSGPPIMKVGDDWGRSPVDSFVLARLTENKLHPNTAADRRTLAQRLSILLVGLPMSKPELDHFENDISPDAYERLVERLLASPQFGATWGRHWLDLARFADSNGLDENFLFREAWRYRNWVIEAINRDQPFDEFTKEQIAGDLLPFKSIEERDRQRIGAGFLVIGPKVLLGVNGELQKMDVADELISTVGTTFLAQTLGCARCHDHKFDPVPTEDYYAMAGIFTSTEVMQTRYMLGQQRKMERLFGLGPKENETNAAYEKYWRERGQLKKQLDQSKAVLELLKKPGSDLAELLQKNAGNIDPELKKQLEKLIASGVKRFKNDTDEKADKKDQKGAIALQQKRVQSLTKQYTQPPPIPPRAMIPVDKPKPADEMIRIAGQFDRKGEPVTRGFLKVLTDGSSLEIPQNSSGRLELANWLTDVDGGAGRLTARVLVNRIWHHLIGRGIVRTTDNFGRTGEKPNHPELLDFLAGELIDSDWSVKHVVRVIVLSQTFRQSSSHNEHAEKVDPENRLLWRANRRRLTPEAYRDRMLKVADQLDQRPLDSTVNYLGDQATAVGANKNRRRTNFPNRSIYLPVIRNDLPEIFEAFDFANAHRPTGNRPETTAATTGLYMLNDQLMLTTSRSLASQVLQIPGVSDSDRVREMYARVLGHPCDENEVNLVLNYVKQVESLTLGEVKSKQTKKDAKAKSRSEQELKAESKLRAWATAVHALFASSRFQILE